MYLFASVKYIYKARYKEAWMQNRKSEYISRTLYDKLVFNNSDVKFLSLWKAKLFSGYLYYYMYSCKNIIRCTCVLSNSYELCIIWFFFLKLHNEIGQCQPLWNLYNSIIKISLCQYIVDAFVSLKSTNKYCGLYSWSYFSPYFPIQKCDQLPCKF